MITAESHQVQLRARVWAFRAGDHPHPRRVRQRAGWQQAGQLAHLRELDRVAVDVDRAVHARAVIAASTS